MYSVALRKESVDRNRQKGQDKCRALRVALRKESVDRNVQPHGHHPPFLLSLSARRAWIEIPPCRTTATATFVALRKESVDRNLTIRVRLGADQASLSARRAWIEICYAVPNWG